MYPVLLRIGDFEVTTFGALVALAFLRFSFRGRGLLLGMAGLPLLVPYVVLGVAFFLLFDEGGVAHDVHDRFG